MMRSFLYFMIALLLCSRAVAMDGETARQILSQKCYKCHGPDSEAREAELRLDTREGAFAMSDGRAAVVPGKPRQSTLIQRITVKDPAERMPPADSTLSLSPDEIEQLEQ